MLFYFRNFSRRKSKSVVRIKDNSLAGVRQARSTAQR